MEAMTRMSGSRRALRVCVLLSAFSSSAIAQQTARMMVLNDDGTMPTVSEVYDVSDDGQYVVGSGVSANGLRDAFVWDLRHGFRTLGRVAYQGNPDYFGSVRAFAVSSAPLVIAGQALNVGFWVPLRWTPEGGFRILSGAGGTHGSALDITPDGEFIVGTDGTAAYLWSGSEGIPLQLPRPVGLAEDDYYVAFGLAADGTGAAGQPSTFWSAPWNDAPALIPGMFWGISGDGETAFGGGGVWRADTGWVQLPHIAGYESRPGLVRMNHDGTRAVGLVRINGGSQSDAVYWTDSSGPRVLEELLATDHGLDLTAWRLTVGGISADGLTVVGQGLMPNGQRVAYRVELGAPILLGDMNCDGTVSVGDIAGFVLALTDRRRYLDNFPTCHPYNADTNQNGVVNVADIAGFISHVIR